MVKTTKSVISITEHFHVINLKLDRISNSNKHINKENEKTQIIMIVISCAYVRAFVCGSENVCISFLLNKLYLNQ